MRVQLPRGLETFTPTPNGRLGLRVVSLTHERLSFWHSVERALGYGASTLELDFGFLQYYLHPYRQTVHDRIAETIVVDERRRHPLKESPMRKNMGMADRVIRTLVAIVIAVLYFTGTISGTLAIVLGIVAILFLVTSFFAVCPGYLPFGFSTDKAQPGSGTPAGD
jgi:hypothetical protein